MKEGVEAIDTQSLTPRAELEARRQRLQARMQQEAIDGTLIIQNADLFYFSGTIQQGQLYIPARGEPVLMVRKDLGRARRESALPQITAFSSPRQLPEILAQHDIPVPGTLGLEMDVLPANQYLNFIRLLENTRMTDISP